MDLANIFYKEIVGVYPFPTQREEAITRHTIAYLQESGVPDADIFRILVQFGTQGGITPDELPGEIWDDSLTEKGQYYVHSRLQLLPPSPIVKMDGTFKAFPYYQEMVARFTIKELCRYFYLKSSGLIMRDAVRDERQLKHMLSKYKNMEKFSALDFVLFLIDEAAFQNRPVSSPFDVDVSSLTSVVADKLIRIMDERRAKGYDKIKWRTYLIEGGEITWQTT